MGITNNYVYSAMRSHSSQKQIKLGSKQSLWKVAEKLLKESSANNFHVTKNDKKVTLNITYLLYKNNPQLQSKLLNIPTGEKVFIPKNIIQQAKRTVVSQKMWDQVLQRQMAQDTKALGEMLEIINSFK